MSHGLAAETVIAALENAADYEMFAASIAADHQPRSATESALVARLASLLWRLRRSTGIETGLFQIQGELMRKEIGTRRRKTVPLPEWYDELDIAPSVARFCEVDGRIKRIRRLRICPRAWPIVFCGSADLDAAP